ncbi:leader peptidase (prepilin peptidase) / N-methyltransferase [Solimonas aquatica]|uniref:Prepilin leader peptidase/N-methyltransferase n=1 Tax=Solimonas aquatica TaxID=489703 RepID=A0A1H9GMD4_9GAMM|nr:A24 family peptidase [Solimonas aquatica]SEQ51209.1 leader peptidase (prepilin peptidase) / N-methyltransferase [Solimonas aquatica]
MSLTQALASNTSLLYLLAGLAGLIVGSFLNVLILRLPPLLEYAWRLEARAVLELPETETPPADLFQPGSHCPHCKTPLRPWQNIPLLSFLLLRGRCAHCAARISLQYPLVELAAALMALACVWRFGYSPQLAAALLLSWTLLALAVMDFQTLLLPDALTLPLLWLGLLAALVPIYAPLPAALLGAAFGYLSLWSLYWLFRLATGKEGMGYGDFKLLALLGAWLGWQALPAIVLLSSISAALVGIVLIVLRRAGRHSAIPFGPYLAAAGWLVLVFGPQLQRWYFEFLTS